MEHSKSNWPWYPSEGQRKLFDKARDDVRVVLEVNFDGIPVTELYGILCTQIGLTPPLDEMGFQNFYHFLYHCPEVYNLRRLPEGKDLYLFVKNKVSDSTTHIRNLVQKQRPARRTQDFQTKEIRPLIGNTYPVETVALLQFKGSPCERRPNKVAVQSAQPFSSSSTVKPAIRTDNEVSSVNVKFVVQNQTSDIKKSTTVLSCDHKNEEKSTKNDKKPSRFKDAKHQQSHNSKAEPVKFEAKILGVDQHGWFYIRKFKPQNNWWVKFEREMYSFYDREDNQREYKAPSDMLREGMEAVAYFTPILPGGKVGPNDYGRVRLVRIDREKEICEVQNIDDARVGIAPLHCIYAVADRFAEEQPAAIRVVLGGMETLLFSTTLHQTFYSLVVREVVKVEVTLEHHPSFECPIVKMDIFNEATRRYEDLRTLLLTKLDKSGSDYDVV